MLKQARLMCHGCETLDVLKTREKTLRVTKNSRFLLFDLWY